MPSSAVAVKLPKTLKNNPGMKARTILAMVLVAAAAMGCSRKYIVDGVSVNTEEYQIAPADWQRNTGDLEPGAYNYLYVTTQNQWITKDVFRYGSVQADAYVIYDKSKNLGAWTPLPYVYPVEITETDSQGNSTTVIVPETLRMEWEEGSVTFVLQDLDGFDPLDMTSVISVRVSVIY